MFSHYGEIYWEICQIKLFGILNIQIYLSAPPPIYLLHFIYKVHFLNNIV